MTQKTLIDYAREFLELGEMRFRLHYGNPVLVQTEENDEDTSLHFKTSFMARPALEARRPDGPEPQASPVWQIEKRSEGAFQERIGVGRTRNADVWIPSQKVSKYHAFFTRREDGTMDLTDAGSKNGTFVGGRRLAPRETAAVPFGSDVGFGPCRFVLTSPEAFHELVANEANRIGR